MSWSVFTLHSSQHHRSVEDDRGTEFKVHHPQSMRKKQLSIAMTQASHSHYRVAIRIYNQPKQVAMPDDNGENQQTVEW